MGGSNSTNRPSNSSKIPMIEINGYMFSLICQFNKGSKTFIKIESVNKTFGDTSFIVYSSRSQLGCWRLATLKSLKGVSLYKGGTDYVQQTFIHIELQVFIKNNIKKIPSCKTSLFHEIPSIEQDRDTDIFNCIDDDTRQIILPPFSILQETIECGFNITQTPRGRTPTDAIREFSEILEEEYTKNTPEVVSDFTSTFEGIMNVKGDIKKILLTKKSHDIPSPGNRVVLYYLDVKLTPINAKQSQPEPIRSVVNKQNHIMPFLLTVEESLVNRFGLYDKYIPSGAFICKLFDYSFGYQADQDLNELLEELDEDGIDQMMHELEITDPDDIESKLFVPGGRQCTMDEFGKYKCTDNYSYIGNRYDNIFPFQGGTRRKCRRTKRKNKRRTKIKYFHKTPSP